MAVRGVVLYGYVAAFFGLVTSLNRPGGNLTGVVSLGAEIAAKRLELLHKSVPATESIAMLVGPADPYTQAETTNVQSAARTLGLRLLLFNATTESEIAAAFATLVERRAGAVLLTSHTQLVPRMPAWRKRSLGTDP
jgi:putative ABC transport system substrate-binding protein